MFWFKLQRLAYTIRHLPSYLQTVHELHRVEDELRECYHTFREIESTHRRVRVTASLAQKEYMARNAIEHIIQVASNPEPDVINTILQYWYSVEDNKVEIPEDAKTS